MFRYCDLTCKDLLKFILLYVTLYLVDDLLKIKFDLMYLLVICLKMFDINLYYLKLHRINQ